MQTYSTNHSKGRRPIRERGSQWISRLLTTQYLSARFVIEEVQQVLKGCTWMGSKAIALYDAAFEEALSRQKSGIDSSNPT